MMKSISFLLVLLMGCGDSRDTMGGCEMTVTCRGHVKESLCVKIVSGLHEEFFGAIGPGPNGRDSGKTIGFGPMQIGEQVKIQWGVEGEDELRMAHECIVDTSAYLPVKKQIKAVEFIYEGKCHWVFKAYDNSPDQHDAKEILPAGPPKCVTKETEGGNMQNRCNHQEPSGDIKITHPVSPTNEAPSR